MKLGVLLSALGDKTFDEALGYLESIGVEAYELGCGGYPGTAHADAKVLISDEAKLANLKETMKKHDLMLSALSVHGNAVHPDKATAAKFHSEFEAAVLLAEKLGIDTVNTFSGCPGDSENSKYPNWVTCPWPDDFLKILDWQWNQVLIPYWEKACKYANDHGVTKIALELHPGFCVYNPASLLKLRAAVGNTIGANLDPSHLFWQGIDMVSAIRALKGAIYHFHAKDTKIDTYNTAWKGVLDTEHYANEANRSWIFRTVGYGHGEETWREIFSELQLVGYDYVASIEHEDSLMDQYEGLEKAVTFLKDVMIHKSKPTGMWWA
jgi:sugar phosphate isomerase/epimerase